MKNTPPHLKDIVLPYSFITHLRDIWLIFYSSQQTSFNIKYISDIYFEAQFSALAIEKELLRLCMHTYIFTTLDRKYI